MRRPRRRVRTIARGRIGFAVTGRTGQARSPVADGTARNRHRMRKAGVELQWRVAGDVAVLAARVLEYLLHGTESDESPGTIRGAEAAVGGQPECQRGGDQQGARGSLDHTCSRSGNSRSR